MAFASPCKYLKTNVDMSQVPEVVLLGRKIHCKVEVSEEATSCRSGHMPDSKVTNAGDWSRKKKFAFKKTGSDPTHSVPFYWMNGTL